MFVQFVSISFFQKLVFEKNIGKWIYKTHYVDTQLFRNSLAVFLTILFITYNDLHVYLFENKILFDFF